jgi:hypothetical protein
MENRGWAVRVSEGSSARPSSPEKNFQPECVRSPQHNLTMSGESVQNSPRAPEVEN